MRDQVLVLNLNDAASRAVTRKLRAERVLAKIVPGDITLSEIREQDPLGLVLAGGTESETIPALNGAVLGCGLPVLALGQPCLSLLYALGGRAGDVLAPAGMGRLSCPEGTPFAPLDGTERMLPPLRELILPEGAVPVCLAENGAVGFSLRDRALYGAQFQVEAVDPEGALLLKHFALNVCCCTTWWDEDAFTAQAVEEIKRIVGGGRALCALTGGLDSCVTALLAFKALGRNLKCLFVDTGLLRQGEAEAILAFYRDEIGMDVRFVRAEERFLSALRGVSDPRAKRRIIADTLQAVLNEERPLLGPAEVLFRGTSSNDIMFSPRQDRPTLDASLPVIEPVRELFKDEIRHVGDFLSVPGDLMSRQDFPAAGLAVRILGEVTEERLAVLRKADEIFRGEVRRSGAEKRLWQYFAVLCPMPEDENGAVICLRAVHASEQSLAYAARLPYDVTEAAVEQIMRSVPQVRRVVYDLTPSTHYAGIEWQ